MHTYTQTDFVTARECPIATPSASPPVTRRTPVKSRLRLVALTGLIIASLAGGTTATAEAMLANGPIDGGENDGPGCPPGFELEADGSGCVRISSDRN